MEAQLRPSYLKSYYTLHMLSFIGLDEKLEAVDCFGNRSKQHEEFLSQMNCFLFQSLQNFRGFLPPYLEASCFYPTPCRDFL